MHRDVCLIPSSAHGTNAASAAMAGMRVVVVACDDQGNVSLDDLRAKAAEHSADLAASMVTYPSTHGVFETGITDICAIVHEAGGQVYVDGANLNALVGLARPGRVRRGCLASQPAQDVLHPARGRRPGDRPGRRPRPPRAVPAQPLVPEAGPATGRPVPAPHGVGRHPADPVGLPAHDGPGRA